MAITAAAMQAELGLTANDALILHHTMPLAGSLQEWYVVGNMDAPGRAKWVTTTAASNAATQAAELLVALRA
jgi:hypothetical protein